MMFDVLTVKLVFIPFRPCHFVTISSSYLIGGTRNRHVPHSLGDPIYSYFACTSTYLPIFPTCRELLHNVFVIWLHEVVVPSVPSVFASNHLSLYLENSHLLRIHDPHIHQPLGLHHLCIIGGSTFPSGGVSKA